MRVAINLGFLKPINVQFLTVDIQKPGLQKLCLVATWAAKSLRANTSSCLCLCCCEKTFSEASGQYREEVSTYDFTSISDNCNQRMVVSTELIKITSFFIQLLFSIILIYGQCNIPNCDSCSSSDLTCTRCVSEGARLAGSVKSAIDVTATITRQDTRATSVVITARVRATGRQEAVLEGVGKGTGELAAKNACSPFCQENACFHTNGTCINECINGFYGLPCETPCGACPCDRTQGTCVGACSVGFYGEQCDIRCHKTCLENRCQRQSGKCVLDCPIGFYGDFCSKNCSTGCQGACNRDTGICSTGCNLGFYGDICNNSCNVNCKTGSCDRFSGNCVGDCRDGYFGDKCSELCVCSKNGNSDQTTDFSPGNPTTTRFSPGVVAVVIVLLGSIANYVTWKRNNVETMRKRNNNRGTVATIDTTRYYSEIQEVDKPNNYEDFKIYTEI
uniref:EGF-like domain-containing protein n=1 Tax=Magallana gigas TaxID=29159 RepID=A0A8W8NRK0_MAGGI